MNFCIDGGWLVGPHGTISSHPSDYLWAKNGVIQGCNRLFCKKCQCYLRTLPQVTTRPQYLSDLYQADLDGQDLSKLTSPSPNHRLYFCRCFFCLIDDTLALEDPEDWTQRQPPPWHCAGHPPLLLSPEQSIGLTPETIAERIVEASLSQPPSDVLTTQYPVASLHRIYRLLDPSPLKDQISRQLSYQLNSLNLHRRASAADFFRREPWAPGAEQVLEIIQENRSGWLNVPNPQYPGHTLDQWLQVVLAQRLPQEPKAQALAQSLILRALPTSLLLEALAEHTPAWLAQNIGIIYKNRPDVETARVLLAETRPLWGRHGETLCQVFTMIHRQLSDPELSQEIRALVPAPWSAMILAPPSP